MNVKVIGIGGTGCALLPTLCRYLNFRFPGVFVTLIDGDEYESKNQERQIFHRIGNKAEVTAERLTPEYPEVLFRARPDYLSDENIVSLIREGDVIFSCVDNHATRKLLSDRGEELREVTIISGGNEYTDGNIQLFVRREGVSITLPLANSYHPEILYPRDKNPAELGCEDLSESSPQLVIMNNAIAAAMLGVFYGHLEGRLNVDEIYVDILTGNNRGMRRSKDFTHP